MKNLNPKEIYRFLESKNIKTLFHANTVTTSCTFISEKGLMSRGCVEKKGLIQTAQSSDQDDKNYNVWNDIFLDIVDLHEYFNRQNFYGPVCFVLDSRLLLDDELPNLCITKNNPIYWKDGMSEEEKYYNSVGEYIGNFDNLVSKRNLHNQMFTIHETQQKISLEKYLIKIILDDPQRTINGIRLYQHAKETLTNALKKSGLEIKKLENRECNKCYCHANYYEMKDFKLENLFL